MSGNPFRASLVPKPTPVSTASTPSSFNYGDSKNVATETRDDVKLPAKTKKSVRIESPASSPPQPAFYHVDSSSDDDLPQQIQEREVAVLSPPTNPAGLSDNLEGFTPEQTFGREVEKRDAGEVPDVTGSSRSHSSMVDAALSPSGAPFNPFSRTLASIEKQEQSSGEGYSAGQNRNRPTSEKTATGTTKPNLDVESFKRLLMTGIQSLPSSGQPPQTAPAPAPAPASTPINPSHFESSSSTDTSSISRQSIFEPVQEPHIESPRTSYEMPASEDDERVGLMGDAEKTEKEKKKPPPPRHRHGKPVTPRTPQVVSFDDFNAMQTPSPVARTRTGSDLNVNKPLPLPPILSPTAHTISQDSTRDESPPLEARASGSSSLSDTPSLQKRIPPPVPIARRQSQLRTSTTGNRSRSNSSLTISSQHSTDQSVFNPGSTNEPTSSPALQKAPPPPPPARRHGASVTNNINPPNNNFSSTELPSTKTKKTPVSSPNPPSSRRPDFSSPPPSPSPGTGQRAGSTRTSSISSNLNPRSVSGESVTTAPPPPPPPRRRQSGRSSLDQQRPYTEETMGSRRTSMENKRTSYDSKRRTSVASESSLRHEYGRASHEYSQGGSNEHVLHSPQEERSEDTQGLGLEKVGNGELEKVGSGGSGEGLRQVSSGSSNILDDMERFQREIDELRKRFPTAG